MNLAVEWEMLAANPLAKLKLFNVDNRVEHYLDDAELQRLLAVLQAGEHQRNRMSCLIAMFLLSTGARLNKALQAKWSQIDQASRVWRIEAATSKSKRVRSVPLNDSALDVLMKVRPKERKSDFVFVNLKTMKPYTSIMRVWRRIRVKAGLPHIRIHDRRHQYAANPVSMRVSGTFTRKFAHTKSRRLVNMKHCRIEGTGTMRMHLPGRLLLCVAAILQGSVAAQEFPTKPIKIVVPFAPGGGADIVARIISDKLSGALGRGAVVENRAGAGGNVGAEAVFRAEPDGYTVLLTTQGPLVVNKSIYAKLSYDPEAFVPVSLVAASQGVLLVNLKVPANTVQELIAYARANPDKLNYASQGIGTTAHLAAELFNSMAQVKITHIPYKGTGPALGDMLAGQVDMMFGELSAADSHIRSGKLRAIAVGNDKRNPRLPDVPSVSEALPGFVVMTWYGMVAPPGTALGIASRLSTSVAETLKQPDMSKRLLDLSISEIGSTPQELTQFMIKERERWGQVIKVAGAKAE